MKELKDYIHLYIGCKLQHVPDDGTIATLIGIDIASGTATVKLFNDDHHMYGECSIDGIKLILRPLSDLTSKEQDELWHADEPLGVISMYNGDNNRKIVLAPERMAYLLSKGFDLFGLRESGLCVYEQDL